MDDDMGEDEYSYGDETGQSPNNMGAMEPYANGEDDSPQYDGEEEEEYGEESLM